MKAKKLLQSLFVSLALAGALTACSDDNDTPSPASKVTVPTTYRAYIMNAGRHGANNSNLTYFDPKGVYSTINRVFFRQNDKNLGNTAESIIEANGSIYIAMYGSNLIYKLNKDGVLETSRTLRTPRYMVADKNYLYVSKWGGEVTKLSLSNLDSISTFTGGKNLEGIAEVNGKLYVSNGSEVTASGQYNYLTELFVINPETMAGEGTITVTANPSKLIATQGKLYCLSIGNYGSIPYSVQEIDVTTKTVKLIATATTMAYGNGKLYMANSVTNWATKVTNVNFLSYDVATSTLTNSTFLGDDTPTVLATTSIYNMMVDPYEGGIYLCTSDYSNNGDLYCFDKDGKFLRKFDTGGINPKEIVFLK